MDKLILHEFRPCTVQDLIDQLSKIEDKSQKVVFRYFYKKKGELGQGSRVVDILNICNSDHFKFTQLEGNHNITACEASDEFYDSIGILV